MRYLYFILIVASMFFRGAYADVEKLKFSLHKLESSQQGPTILVIGGIQGDEPGGFNAASLLVTEYSIHSGNVWVVPNLNFPSIIHRSRGIYGDMNRKFADIKPDDPEYDIVEKIKAIILDKRVDIVLNLHDGSGFYRPVYIDKLHNASRWGQSVIIDQAELPDVKYGNLQQLADEVAQHVNKIISRKNHWFAVKNTHTREGDREMEKTLTYFAIQHQRPAFGVEASKSFLTHERTLFHLQIVEAFMQKLGIEYTRGFNLTSRAVKQRIDNNVKLALYENRIFFDMARARARLSYIPMRKDSPLEFSSSNPLVAVINKKRYYQVRYGNRHVTRLHPEYFEFDDSLQNVKLEIDGVLHEVKLGTAVKVLDKFKVLPLEGYRINVIGFRRKGVRNESGLLISRNDIARRFSVDKSAKFYRVEFYRGNRFCGMVLVDFTSNSRV